MCVCTPEKRTPVCESCPPEVQAEWKRVPEGARPGTTSPATPEPEVVITQDQATGLVGKSVLVLLEEVIKAHELVLADEKASEVRKGNARLVIAAARGLGRPLFHLVKLADRPRILRPERSIKVVR